MNFYDRFVHAYQTFRNPEYLSGLQTDLEKSESARDGKAHMIDPFDVVQATGYKDRQFSLSYDILRQMASRNAVIGSIITTRVNQVSSFTMPARFNSSGLGYEIGLRDSEEKPTDEDKENIVALENFLENTGYKSDPTRDNFDGFIRKIVRDRLTFDQLTFEIVPDRLGRPAEFFAVDSATIRLATEQLQAEAERAKQVNKNEEVRYVQVLHGQVQSYFTESELAFGVANPRTDIKIAGYGYSELEMLIHQVTSHLWAEEYNSRFFSQGGTTKGILNLKGTSDSPISPHMLESFKRQWLSQVNGMTGAWKTPVLSVDGLEYINVSQSNREMEFEKWMNYLINIACAIYQIDPAEINFPNRGGAGGTGGGGLGDGGIADRIQHSKDKGLRPLLRHIESMINKHIMTRFGNRYVFSFVGLDSKSEKEQLDIIKAEVSSTKTVNEARKEKGLPLLEHGDIILDPNYIQYVLQKEQQAAMAEAGGGEMLDDEPTEEYDEEGNTEFEDYEDDDAEGESGSEYDQDELETDETEDEDDLDEMTKSETKFITIELEE